VDTRQYHGIHLVHGDGFWIGVKRICKKLKNAIISQDDRILHSRCIKNDGPPATGLLAGAKCFPKGVASIGFDPSPIRLGPPVFSIGQTDRHTIPHPLSPINPVAALFHEILFFGRHPRYLLFLFLVSHKCAADDDDVHG
jgi:hypothetical protein